MEIFTICNHGYRDYTWNLALHCQRSNQPLTIYSTDSDAMYFLRNQGITSQRFQPASKASKLLGMFGSDAFSSMCRAKLDLICQRIRESSADYLVYMDGDIAVLRNFEENIKECLADVNLAFQCDEKDPKECSMCPNACTGFIAIRLKGADREALLNIFDVNRNKELWRKVKGLDQDFVNETLKHTRLFWSTLPRNSYPNGVYVNKRVLDMTTAFIIHFNYMVGSQKRQRMNQLKQWILPIHF